MIKLDINPHLLYKLRKNFFYLILIILHPQIVTCIFTFLLVFGKIIIPKDIILGDFKKFFLFSLGSVGLINSISKICYYKIIKKLIKNENISIFWSHRIIQIMISILFIFLSLVLK